MKKENKVNFPEKVRVTYRGNLIRHPLHFKKAKAEAFMYIMERFAELVKGKKFIPSDKAFMVIPTATDEEVMAEVINYIAENTDYRHSYIIPVDKTSVSLFCIKWQEKKKFNNL